MVNLEFLLADPIDSGKSGGIAPMIVSTIIVTVIAVLVAAPLGVGAAVFIEEYTKENIFVKLIRFGSETLASIPSIVFGLFGLAFLCCIPWYGMVSILRRTCTGLYGTSNNITSF